MKDAHCIMWYIVNFNQLASQVQDYGDGTLCCLFYSSLPDHLKDEIAQVGKPLTLHGLRAHCQETDVLVLVISTSSYDSITYYHGLPYLLPTCFSFIAAL